MSRLQDQNVHTAANMIIKVHGKEVGRANGVEITVDLGMQPVPKGIGSIMPAEHVALGYQATFSINSFFIRKRTVAGNAGAQDVLGVPVNENVLLTQTFNLEVIDKTTGQTILAALNCSWGNVSFSVNQGAISGKNASGSALLVSQAPEYEPSLV